MEKSLQDIGITKTWDIRQLQLQQKVSINGKEEYIAVAIKGTKDARYNAHKIISAEGKFGYEKNAGPTRFERDQLKTEQRFDIGSAFLHIIVDSIQESQDFFEENRAETRVIISNYGKLSPKVSEIEGVIRVRVIK